jgi:hypothetical protein
MGTSKPFIKKKSNDFKSNFCLLFHCKNIEAFKVRGNLTAKKRQVIFNLRQVLQILLEALNSEKIHQIVFRNFFIFRKNFV